MLAQGSRRALPRYNLDYGSSYSAAPAAGVRGLGAEGALRRPGADEGGADQRSADFAGRQDGGLHGAERSTSRTTSGRLTSTPSRWLAGQPRQLTKEGTLNERPRWSPDSRQIAFISDRGGSSQVWLMNADGSSPKQVTRPLDRGGRRAVLPGRQAPGVHERGVPGLRRRRLQQAEARGREGVQDEGPCLHLACCTGIGPSGRASGGRTFW